MLLSFAFFFFFDFFHWLAHPISLRPKPPPGPGDWGPPLPHPWGPQRVAHGAQELTFLGPPMAAPILPPIFPPIFFATNSQRKRGKKNWCENWRVAWRHALAQKLAAKLAHFWRHVAGTFGMLSLSFGRSFEFHFLKNYIFLFGPSGAHSN